MQTHEQFLEILVDYNQQYLQKFKLVKFTKNVQILKNNESFLNCIDKIYNLNIISVEKSKNTINIFYNFQNSKKIVKTISIHIINQKNTIIKKNLSEIKTFDFCFEKRNGNTQQDKFTKNQIISLLHFSTLKFFENDFKNWQFDEQIYMLSKSFTNLLILLNHQKIRLQMCLLAAIVKNDKKSTVNRLTLDSLRVICEFC